MKRVWLLGYLLSCCVASYSVMVLAPFFAMILDPHAPAQTSVLGMVSYIFFCLPIALTFGLLIALVVSAPLFAIFYGTARLLRIKNVIYFMFTGSVNGNSVLISDRVFFGPNSPDANVVPAIVFWGVIGALCGWIFWRIAVKPTTVMQNADI